jgi:hypothetical protein
LTAGVPIATGLVVSVDAARAAYPAGALCAVAALQGKRWQRRRSDNGKAAYNRSIDVD